MSAPGGTCIKSHTFLPCAWAEASFESSQASSAVTALLIGITEIRRKLECIESYHHQVRSGRLRGIISSACEGIKKCLMIHGAIQKLCVIKFRRIGKKTAVRSRPIYESLLPTANMTGMFPTVDLTCPIKKATVLSANAFMAATAASLRRLERSWLP